MEFTINIGDIVQRIHFDTEQMCLMWSTDNPPDEIEGTEPFNDIEEAFNIAIDDKMHLKCTICH